MKEHYPDAQPWHGLSFSNLLTYSSLISGLLGYVLFSKTGNIQFVGLFLCLSFIFDIFDGQFARSFKNRTAFVSELGGYLDSLTDFAVFGILPAIAYLQIPDADQNIEIFSFFIAAIFTISAMTRLGAFHILSSTSNHFRGIPTTLSGLTLSVCLYFTESKLILSCVLLLLAILMVSSFSIPRPQKKGLFILTSTAILITVLYIFKIYS